MKYVTFSFDDGLEQDKQIIEILKSFGLRGCTFNLNAGLLGERTAIGRIGEIGVRETPNLSVLEKRGLLRYHPHFRIPADEICQVYRGFELAAHGFRHQNLSKLEGATLEEEICRDKEALEALTGRKIVGFAYAYGAASDAAVDILKKNGFLYARTVTQAQNFSRPADPLRLAPTRWIGSKDLEPALRDFLAAPAGEQDTVFYIWGHGYELDYGTPCNNWERFRRICALVAGGDALCCTNRELFEATEETV